MTAPSGFVALSDGGRVAFESRGEEHGGTPVLLLRPLMGAMGLWGAFRDVLAQRFRVIAFDPRGTGPSTDSDMAATTRDMARDAVSVLDALAVPRAHVFGISFGAMVATWVAIDASSRVDRLCLASAGPTGLALSPSGLARDVVMVASALLPGARASARLPAVVLSENVRRDQPERVEEIAAASADEPTDRIELAKHALAAARHDARAELHQIVAPTLVLCGDHDELMGEAPTIALAAGITGARREVIREAGHDLTLEQPEATARRVADFFSETTLRP